MHSDARERSPSALSSAEEMIRAAIDRELNALVINDHDSLTRPGRDDYLNARYGPFRVFAEVRVTGCADHCLVLGVGDDVLDRTCWGPEKECPTCRSAQVVEPRVVRKLLRLSVCPLSL